MLTLVDLKLCLLLQLGESWDEPVYKSTCFSTCVWACLSDKNTPCTTGSLGTKQRHWMSHKGVCVWVCECSHPFTTITQTSQASGSVPKPSILMTSSVYIVMVTYRQTSSQRSLIYVLHLAAVKAAIHSGGAGDPAAPVNLLIYYWVLFLSSLLLQVEKNICQWNEKICHWNSFKSCHEYNRSRLKLLRPFAFEPQEKTRGWWRPYAWKRWLK